MTTTQPKRARRLTVGLRISEDALVEVNRWAEAEGRTRSDMLRRLLAAGLVAWEGLHGPVPR